MMKTEFSYGVKTKEGRYIGLFADKFDMDYYHRIISEAFPQANLVKVKFKEPKVI